MNIDQARINKSLYDAMRKGTDLLQNINKTMTIEDVERLMDENAEAIAYQEEIGQILSQQGIMEDDEDLLSELDMMDEMDALEVGEKLPEVPKDALEVGEKMPEAPKEQLPATQNFLKAVIKESKPEPAVLIEN